MSSVRFFENSFTGAQRQGLTQEQIIFLTTSNSATANTVVTNLATFNNKTLLTPPQGFTFDENSLTVYVNGVAIPPQYVNIQQVGSNITATFLPQSIGYNIEPTDTVVLTGKFT